MTDEHELIKARLGKLGIGTRREEEILRELSEHLADHAATLEARGVAPDAAARETVDTVSDWPDLRHEIFQAETEEGKTQVLSSPCKCAR